MIGKKPGPPKPPGPPGPQMSTKQKKNKKHGLLKEFQQNIVTDPTTNIPLSADPSLLASVTLNNNKTDNRVWITGTIQTLVDAVDPGPRFVEIQLQIFRNDPTFTTPLFSISDVVVYNGDINLNTTTFNFVDTAPTVGSNTYYLTARITAQDDTTSVVVNSVVFTGAEIKVNQSQC